MQKQGLKNLYHYYIWCMYYDAHTHLNAEKLYPERENHLQNFINQGGKGLINIGVNEAYNQKGVTIAQKRNEKHPNSKIIVKATCGIHPCEVWTKAITEKNYKDAIDKVESMIKKNQQHIVGLGEIGIDTYYPGTQETLIIQQKAFDLQCKLAKKLDMPIIIHSRANFKATHEVLQSHKELTIYFHCRGYEVKEVDILLNNYKDIYIGFCGNLTYKKTENIRESLQHLRKQKSTSVILETDAPYLSPQKVRKETNQPAHVKYIYEEAAVYLSIPLQTLQKQLKENFYRLYRLS